MVFRGALPLLLLASAVVTPACRRERKAELVADPYAKDWAVDPGTPGPDLPPAGQSLFDALVADPVPFPFSRLLESVRAQTATRNPARRILIPLGRSLQRSAGAPRFFHYPRAVAAFDNDRLFLGYHEKSGVIEVISYNETAGRFEFQLVKNYREGATPRVFYAHRNICTTCHQNHAPLFPRQLWDETNSNYRVYRLLVAEQRDFYGFPIQQSADVPYQIDLAVHRANEFSVYQRLWAACDAKTRAVWLGEMLRCRLTGNCRSVELEKSLAKVWSDNWPRGLRIPNPEIPNRNPLAILSREGPQDDASAVVYLAELQKKIDQQFEPAVRRLPLDHWAGDSEHIERVVAGSGSFFSEDEIRELDMVLVSLDAEPKMLRARCSLGNETTTRSYLRCEPAGEEGFSIEARLPGAVISLKTGGEVVRDLEITALGPGSFTLKRSNASARCADGSRIVKLTAGPGEAALECRRDFDVFARIVDRLSGEPALQASAFQASALLGLLSREFKAPRLARAPLPGPHRKPVLESN